MATFAYGRVSTKEQTAGNQKMEIEAAGHQVDYWYADTISGKTSASERPEFAALLAQIRNGETLVVAKLDRLGRARRAGCRRHGQAFGRTQDCRHRAAAGQAGPDFASRQDDDDYVGSYCRDGARFAGGAHASWPGPRQERRQDAGPAIKDNHRAAR